MQHKTKKIWLIALLSLLIAALFAASFTYARYYKETGVTGGKYDDTIEFVGANKYIVYTPEELVAAIENGYSYIEIAEGVEDPFVITDGVTDVSANLVLDINGHDLVRNSRNPLIDVQENVSVVIVYDSKASGSFYNPVGSLLQASGGTLTIATGEFTSGPKAENYVTDVGTPKTVTVYSRSGRGATAYDETENVSMPAPSDNMYFADGTFANGESNKFIKDDTFLIYTEETVDASEGTTVDFEPLCDVASCDFYYYYVTDTDGSGDEQTTTYAVVYGYNDVMAGAEQQITKEGFNTSGSINNNSADAVIWPYAAVRMTEGEAFIRGGTYTNQFGTAQSYGIYARGGSLSVQGANTSFTSVADGVCIRCTKEGDAAPSLHIENGSFTSYNGDTVRVNGGTMTLASGTFTKTATKDGTQSAMIRMTGGSLECSANAHDIVMTCGGTDSEGKEAVYSNLYGIYSVGGTVALNNATITVSGTYSCGILAEYDPKAQQQVQTDSNMVELTNTNITVEDGITNVPNDNRSVLSSTAISTRGGTVSFEGGTNIVTSDGIGITASPAVNENGVIVGEDDKPVAVGQVTVVKGETTVNAKNATGVYVYGGNLQVDEDGKLTVNSTILTNSVWANQNSTTTVSDYEYQSDGVLIDGGSLESNGTLDVTFTGLTNTGHDNYDNLNIRSFAVRVLNAEEVKINSGHIINGTWQVNSDGNFVLDSEKNRIPKENSGQGGGVYVGGGTVKLGDETTKTGPTVTTTGTSKGELVNLLGDKDYGTWDYEKNVGGGSAVSVEGGELTIYGGTYTAALGDGIFVNSGTATVKGGSFVGKGGATAGVAANYGFKMYGGTVNISGGTFGNSDSDSSGAFVMGKSSVDKATISGGTFEVGGATAFSVWQSANVEFNGGTFKGASTGLAIETHTASETQTQITVKGGTFTANTSGNLQSGIWYGNSTSSLTITAGTFTGGTAGLYFGAVPNENNVQLSGGTYYGPDNSVYWEDRFDYGNYITTNAIAGESNLSYRTIASGCSVVGYTELGDNFSVDGARVDEDYTRSANLSNLHDKGTVTLRIDWGVIGYEVDLVFSRIEIMQQ